MERPEVEVIRDRVAKAREVEDEVRKRYEVLNAELNLARHARIEAQDELKEAVSADLEYFKLLMRENPEFGTDYLDDDD